MPPPRLIAFQEQIADTNPELKQVGYNSLSWATYFAHCPLFLDIVHAYADHLTRANVREIGVPALVDISQTKRLFLATMIWGFGRVGYGPYRTHTMLQNHNVSHILQTTFSAIGQGQTQPAYENFVLFNCGPSFYTKYLYFAGLVHNVTPLPLVFDSRVARAFKRLIDDIGLEFGEFARATMANDRLQPRRFSRGYVNYVNIVNQWAGELQCRADAIELFLFDPPADFWTWHGG